MSDPGGIPPKKSMGRGGTKDSPPSQEGFTSLVSFWDQSGVNPGSESEVDPLEVLREKEAELKRQGEELIANARGEASRIEEEAYRKGFAQGEEAGRAQGRKTFELAAQRLESVMAAIAGQLTEKNSRYEEELLLLVTTMVDRLVHHEVSTNPRVIQACLVRALAFVVEKSLVKVHLHPDDFSRIKEASLENPTLLEGKKRIELMEDGSVGEGGCFLETDFGDVDASLEHGREKLYEAVDQAFRLSFADDASAVAVEVPADPLVADQAGKAVPLDPAVTDQGEITETPVAQVSSAVPDDSESPGLVVNHEVVAE